MLWLCLPNSFLDKYVQSIHYVLGTIWDTGEWVLNTQATPVLMCWCREAAKGGGTPNKRRKNGDRDCQGQVLAATWRVVRKALSDQIVPEQRPEGRKGKGEALM